MPCFHIIQTEVTEPQLCCLETGTKREGARELWIVGQLPYSIMKCTLHSRINWCILNYAWRNVWKSTQEVCWLNSDPSQPGDLTQNTKTLWSKVSSHVNERVQKHDIWVLKPHILETQLKSHINHFYVQAYPTFKKSFFKTVNLPFVKQLLSFTICSWFSRVYPLSHLKKFTCWKWVNKVRAQIPTR